MKDVFVGIIIIIIVTICGFMLLDIFSGDWEKNDKNKPPEKAIYSTQELMPRVMGMPERSGVYLIKVDGVEYIFVQGYSGVAICRK